MRKLLIVLMALVLLLCGCTQEAPVQTEETTPIETEPVEYYIEDSEIEKQTQGAVRQYALPENVLWIKNADKYLLIGTENGVQLMEGATGLVVASTRLDASYPDDWKVIDTGFAFYEPENNCIVLMDQKLNAKSEITLTEEMETPIISLDGNSVYYCTGQEIRVYEVEHRVSRLLKSHTYTSQKLVDTYFDGKILACNVTDEVAGELTVYISTENGETLSTGVGIQELYSGNDQYLVVRSDGVVEQRIVGSLEGEPKLLNAPDDYLAGALEMNSVVGYGLDQEAALTLNLYDIHSGLWTFCATLGNYSLPSGILADANEGYIWLLTDDGETECLLRWKPTEKPNDETVYLGTVHTAQNPDKDGLKKLQDRVSRMNETYGVRIRIWDEAVEVKEGHILKSEYQVEAITQVLDELEMTFNEFPTRFIQNSIRSRVRICIVRSVDSEVKGTQFWSEKYAFVLLCPGTDIRSEFLKNFGFVVDSHVLGNSPLFDYWTPLNPEGFTYGTVNEELCTGENRAFVDTDSMKNVTTDRSRVFWQAMMPGNDALFASETMQKKLELLCKAIRDAWKLEKKTEIYPWEQYLAEPIAPQK